MVNPKPNIFRFFSWVLGRPVCPKIPGICWVLVVSDFLGKFRESLGFLSAAGFLVKIPGISGVRRGISAKIPQNYEVSVLPWI